MLIYQGQNYCRCVNKFFLSPSLNKFSISGKSAVLLQTHLYISDGKETTNGTGYSMPRDHYQVFSSNIDFMCLHSVT